MTRWPNFRAILRIARLAMVLLWRYVAYRFERRRPSRHVAGFLADTTRILGGDVTIAGTPLLRDVLFVANHQSWFDIVALGGATGPAFVSKAEVDGWPIVGTLARIAQTIMIDREQRSATLDQAAMIRAKLATGHPVALFAEGTTAGGIEVLPFRASLFAAVAPAPPGVRVQPIAIDYGAAYADIVWGRDESAPDNAFRLMGRKGRMAIRMTFLEPLDPSMFPGRKPLAEVTRERIVAALERSSPERGGGSPQG